MIVAKHQMQGNTMICVTDEDILGKKFVEGNRQLDLSSGFYQGQTLEKEDIKLLLKAAYVAHFTGKKSVALGIELDLIAPNQIIHVQQVPHAEVIIEQD